LINYENFLGNSIWCLVFFERANTFIHDLTLPLKKIVFDKDQNFYKIKFFNN